MGDHRRHHHHHHHHGHHHHQEEAAVYYPQAPAYGMVPEGGYGDYYPGAKAAYPAPYPAAQVVQMPNYEEYYRQEENKHKHREHVAEVGAVAAGAFALYERHQIKSDPEHAHRHKIEEEAAAAAAVAAGGYALYEHHEKKKAHKHMKEASGHKHHHHHRHGHHLF